MNAPDSTGDREWLDSASRVEPLESRLPVVLDINPDDVYNLPFFLAIDRGEFDRVGIDLEIRNNQAPVSTLLSSLEEGEIDMLVGGTPPRLFESATNRGSKLIASNGAAVLGRTDSIILTVRSDLADEIRDLPDLKGRLVETANPGDGGWVLAAEAIRVAGLEKGRDVRFGRQATSNDARLALARDKAADVITMSEPTATEAERQGLVKRWKGWSHIAPWRQPSYLIASAGVIDERRPAVVKLLEVLVTASREVNATEGEWTQAFIDTMTHWTKRSSQSIIDQGLVPAFHPDARVSEEALRKVRQLFERERLLDSPVDIEAMVDHTVLDDAISRVGSADS